MSDKERIKELESTLLNCYHFLSAIDDMMTVDPYGRIVVDPKFDDDVMMALFKDMYRVLRLRDSNGH